MKLAMRARSLKRCKCAHHFAREKNGAKKGVFRAERLVACSTQKWTAGDPEGLESEAERAAKGVRVLIKHFFGLWRRYVRSSAQKPPRPLSSSSFPAWAPRRSVTVQLTPNLEREKKKDRSQFDRFGPHQQLCSKSFHNASWSALIVGFIMAQQLRSWLLKEVSGFFLSLQAGQFKPPNQSKQQSSRTPNAKKMLHAAVSETSSMASTQLPYYIPICRIWRPLLIKIKRGCHFCFSFVWFFFLINCLRMLEMRRFVSVGSKWNECCL